MEYPFKDLLPLDEVLEREGYYKDWTHLDPEVFYSLTQISEYIKTKGFGVDVRLLIAQLAEHFGLKTAQINEIERLFKDVMKELSEDKDFYNLPEIAGARGGFDTLGDRLNDTTARLAQTHHEATRKRQLEDLDEKVISAIEGGEGTSFNLLSIPQDGSVTPYKTTFAKVGKNKFDGRYVRSALEGGTNPVYKVSEDDFYSAIVMVEPNKTYTISKEGGSRFRASAATHYPQHNDAVRRLFAADTSNRQTISTLDNEHYIIIYVSDPSAQVPEWLQVEEGGQATGYERQKVIVDLDKNAVNMDMIENGSMHAYLSGQSLCFDIDTKNKKVYTLYKGGFVSIGNKAYSLKDGEFDYSSFPFLSVVVVFNIKTKDVEFKAVDSPELLELKDEYAVLGVFRLNDDIYFINGMYRIDGNPVKPFTGSETPKVIDPTPTRPTFLITDLVNEDYEPISPFIPHINRNNIDELYGIYDSSVSTYPDYLSRQLLRRDATDLPIYMYKSRPGKPQSSSNITGYRLPKILFTHMHGHEKQAAYSAARFFKDLFGNWDQNSALSMIRWNAEIDIVPIVNPWGFNNSSRLNSNGVDINRNFPTGWTPDYNDIDYDYPGESPASEIETQVILDLMENGGYDLVIDHHQYGGLQDSSHVFYYNARDTKIKATLASVAQSFAPYFKKTFPNIPMNNDSIVRVAGGVGVDDSLGYTEWYEKGIKSVLIETGVSVGQGGSSEDVQKMQSYIVGNTLAKLIQHYDWML